MIKIGNLKIETFPISQCNLKHLVSNVYITPILFTYCPICGQRLTTNYVFGIQISKKECVKIHGNLCSKCNAYFSNRNFLFSKLEKIRIDKSSYSLKNDYNIPFDSQKYSAIYQKTKSVYKQFILCKKGQIVTYTIVYDETNVDIKNNIIHYSSEISYKLLNCEKNNNFYITIDDNKFTIVEIKNSSLTSNDITEEIDRVLSTKIYFHNEIPNLSTQHTLYVYNGNIKCHKTHHISEFRAKIQIPEYPLICFYVEYCYECNKFLIKYSDYSSYLKKFKLFPLKVNLFKSSHNDFYRADKSPLLLNGYTVNSNIGYSSHTRQSILAFILDHGILERRKVLDYLEMFIRDNHGKIATQKYIDDKNFVLNYQLDSLPLVKIFNIERK